jgi:hypothetical protein
VGVDLGVGGGKVELEFLPVALLRELVFAAGVLGKIRIQRVDRVLAPVDRDLRELTIRAALQGGDAVDELITDLHLAVVGAPVFVETAAATVGGGGPHGTGPGAKHLQSWHGAGFNARQLLDVCALIEKDH